MKHIKYLLITIFLFLLPAKAFADNCNIINSSSLTNGNLQVNYINADDSSGNVTANLNSSALLPHNTKSISGVYKNIVIDFSSDEVILQGSLQFVSFNDSTVSSVNPNVPNVNNIPAPFIIANVNTSYRSYCEFLDTSISSNQNFVQDLGVNSTTLLTPRLSHFSFTLRCYRNNDFLNTSATYRLYFPLYFNFFPNTDLSLNTDYYVASNFSSSYLKVSNSCPLDSILGEIQSLGFDISDINDNIVDVGDKLDNIGDFLADDSVSSSVLGATSFFNQQDGSYYGLADFVSAIINFLRAIYNDYSCTPLQLPAILGTSLTLPCFSEWLHDFNETIYNLWKMVLYFYVGFVICSDLIKFIHDLRDPQNDNLTVMDI